VPHDVRISDDERRELFAVAYSEHCGPVHGLARRVCGPSFADEVTQSVFLRLWAHPDAFDPARGSLRTFLLTMTHSAAVDLIRAETSHRARDDRAAKRDVVPRPDVDAALLHDETVERISLALDALPERERDAIVTAFYGQCSYREAAAVLGEAEGTNKSRIRAGLNQLREELAELFPLSLQNDHGSTPRARR
jgi:RNA polymerase sigma-70 factor (ECF subfamily)